MALSLVREANGIILSRSMSHEMGISFIKASMPGTVIVDMGLHLPRWCRNGGWQFGWLHEVSGACAK